jgi:phosphotriesterase-related protein
LGAYNRPVPYLPDPTGFVRTVTDDIPPGDLGITLPHEHLLLTRYRWKREAGLPLPDAGDDPRSHEPIMLRTADWVRRHGRHPDEPNLTDEAVAIEEAARFMAAGGRTFVDATNTDLARDPAALVRIARATGLNIVMGAGHYLGSYHPLDMDSRSEDDLVAEIVRDVTDGAEGTAIRSGIIGEIGVEHPMAANERKSLRAAARAQRVTGAGLLVHPGRDSRSPFDVVELLREAGADLSHTVIAHIDRTLFTHDEMRRLAETGVYLEFDLFGQESSYYQYAPIDMPNDATRIDHLTALAAEGFGDQLLISQDICRKTCLVTWGGWGYAHILENVVPVMRRKGMTAGEVDRILVDNPADMLTFR